MPKTKKLHCFCRKENDGSFMIYCENCHIWFHGECVNMSQKASKRISQWFCMWCSMSLSTCQKTAEEHKQLLLNVSKIQGELNQLKASIESRNQPPVNLVDGPTELGERNTCEEADKGNLIKRSEDLTARNRQLEQEKEDLLGEIAAVKSKCEEISSIHEAMKVQNDHVTMALQQENLQLKQKLTDQEESRNQDLAHIRVLEEENGRLLGELGPLKSKCLELNNMLIQAKKKSRLSLSKKL